MKQAHQLAVARSRPLRNAGGLDRRPTTMQARTSISDPRVEQRVDHIDEKIDRDVACAEQQHDTLNDRIVAVQDGIQSETSDAWYGKDAFGNDRSAYQGGEPNPITVMIGMAAFFSACLTAQYEVRRPWPRPSGRSPASRTSNIDNRVVRARIAP